MKRGEIGWRRTSLSRGGSEGGTIPGKRIGGWRSPCRLLSGSIRGEEREETSHCCTSGWRMEENVDRGAFGSARGDCEDEAVQTNWPRA